MEKTMKVFRLSSDSIQYMEEVQEKYQLESQRKTLEFIISEHKNDTLKIDLAKAVSSEVEARLNDILTGIRLSSRFADKNVQIILEMLNTLFIEKGWEEAYLTDVIPSGAFEKSKIAVEDKIKTYREMQISNSKKKKVQREKGD